MAKSCSDHTDFNLDDVDVLEKKVAFKGYFRIEEYTLRHKKHDGGWSAPVTREIFERGHAAAMLLYDAKKDIIILIEQFRPGAYGAGYNPWLLEVPAGIIEAGETPETVAKRETFEETGCQAKRVEFICDYLVSPGGTTESMHLYCVEIDSDEAFEFGGLEEEGEHIAVIKLPRDEAVQMVSTGKVHNSMTIIALQWLQINGDIIREKWCS